jgi:hypothetical protein
MIPSDPKVGKNSPLLTFESKNKLLRDYKFYDKVPGLASLFWLECPWNKPWAFINTKC